MSSAYKDKLALRREALLLKVHAQRQLFSLQTQELQHSIEFAEFSLNFAAKVFVTIKNKPILGAVLAAAVYVVKPARALSLIVTSLRALQTWRKLAPLLKQTQNQ